MKKPALYSDRFTVDADSDIVRLHAGVVRIGFLEAEGNVGSTEHTAVVTTFNGAVTLAVEVLRRLAPGLLNAEKPNAE